MKVIKYHFSNNKNSIILQGEKKERKKEQVADLSSPWLRLRLSRWSDRGGSRLGFWWDAEHSAMTPAIRVTRKFSPPTGSFILAHAEA